MNLGSAFAALHASGVFADHAIQTDHQACTKAAPGRQGHIALAGHVGSYTATQVAALAAVALVTGERVTTRRALSGLAFCAGSHYLIDRRWPLQWFAERTGKGKFYALGKPREGRDDNVTIGTGAYALDQAAHLACVLVAALIIAGGERR